MLISDPLPFVKEFINALDAALKAHRPLGPGLSLAQRSWLGFCLMGILITNTVCWAKFERTSLGRYSLAALSWMFRRTKIPRELLLQLSVQTILQRYGISEGCLGVDDSDKGRSKVTKKIAHVHKLKDKASGGFIRGQNLIFLLLITPKVTIPVGFVIALKYQGEEQYRYLVATDLTWRTLDIVQAYTFRWLVEVFIVDWKAHEGWGALTKQPGEEGSSRSLILSLLVDHCLLLHPDQLARVENKQPAYTVGSLSNRVKVDSLLTIIRELVTANNPVEQLQRLAQQLEELFPLNPSGKHMVDRDMGRLEPTPSLKYKAIA